MSLGRLHSTAHADFFKTFVMRYPDKQYQTWLGTHFTNVGIDYDYDKHLQDRIYAGIANHFFGFSFSRSLQLVKDKQRTNPIPRFEKALDAVESTFFSTSTAFLQMERPEEIPDEHVGIVHAELFLLRLLTSLDAARRLINWGFFSEPLTILRSSLEQLAWIYAIGVEFDQKQLENPQPSKCIGKLKNRFAAAGNLYGALSRFSHMDFEAQKHFVTREEIGSGIMEQSTEFKFFGLLFYSMLLIAYQYVCRDLRSFYLREHELKYTLRNVVLPLRYLVAHALFRPELDRDEIGARLSLIYFDIFPSEAKRICKK